MNHSTASTRSATVRLFTIAPGATHSRGQRVPTSMVGAVVRKQPVDSDPSVVRASSDGDGDYHVTTSRTGEDFYDGTTAYVHEDYLIPVSDVVARVLSDAHVRAAAIALGLDPEVHAKVAALALVIAAASMA